MLPPRGTGLIRGTARQRRWPPLTEAGRLERHKRIYAQANGTSDTAVIISLAGIAIGAGIIIGLVLFK